MNKQDVVKAFRTVKLKVAKHSPEILVGAGITGMFTMTVLAVRSTPKALKLIEEAKKKEHTEKLTPKQVVKATWKCYVPAAAIGVVSAGCIIGASTVHLRRNAALATAYKLSETTLTKYREKVIETIGEKKEQLVQDKVNEEIVKEHQTGKNEIIVTGKGNTRCLDPVSGRFFTSNIEHIKKVANELNRQMINDICGYVSLNEFYCEIGLSPTSVGEELGWNVANGLIDIDPGAQLCEDGEPAIVINYRVPPKYKYADF
jgi:hypothetical protein